MEEAQVGVRHDHPVLVGGFRHCRVLHAATGLRQILNLRAHSTVSIAHAYVLAARGPYPALAGLIDVVAEGALPTFGCCRRYQISNLLPASLTQSTRDCCPAPTPARPAHASITQHRNAHLHAGTGSERGSSLHTDHLAVDGIAHRVALGV